MHPADYRAALGAAHSEIRELLQQRTKLDERLNQLKNTVDALSLLLKDSPANSDGFSNAYGALVGIEGLAAPGAGEMGISDAIRQILSNSQVPMSPTGIRNELIKQKFSLAEYANPLAVIHNTLKRLLTQAEIMGVRDSSQQIVAYARIDRAEAAMRNAMARKSNPAFYAPLAGSPGVTLPTQDDERTAEEEMRDATARNKDFPQRLGKTIMPRNTK